MVYSLKYCRLPCGSLSAHSQTEPNGDRCCTLLYLSLCAQNAGKAEKTADQKPAESRTKCHGPIEILSDTKGVKFEHYKGQILNKVRKHWYKVIPEGSRPPVSKKGVVGLEFAIEKVGQVKELRIVGSSGDASLDHAAWTGFTSSVPFPRLSSKFKEDYVAVRICFFYNPDMSVISAKPTP
jgi:TonB family protein